MCVIRYDALWNIAHTIQNELSWISLKWIYNLKFSNLAQCTHHIFRCCLLGYRRYVVDMDFPTKVSLIMQWKILIKWNEIALFNNPGQSVWGITKLSRLKKWSWFKSLDGLTLLAKPQTHTGYTSPTVNKHNQKHHSGDRGVFVRQKPMVLLEWVVFFMETVRY